MTEAHNPSDPFVIVENLIAILADPKSAKAHIQELRSTLAAVSQAQIQLAADRAAFAEERTKVEAEFAEERAAILKRRTETFAAKTETERQLKEREERVHEAETALGWASDSYAEFVPVPGSTMTKANEHRLSHEGFAGDAFPRESTLTRAFPALEPPAGVRIARPRHLRRSAEL